VHPNLEGNTMNTRRTSYMLIAAVVSALMLAPWLGAVWPQETDLPPIPVQGPLSPNGRFVGTLTVETVTVAGAGHLLLTGVLHGTATHRDGATTRVRRQAFTAPAVPMDDVQTTDVVLLQMAPITLVSVGRQLTLAPVPLDIEAVPDESLLFPVLLN
jgi:hypothetical protein